MGILKNVLHENSLHIYGLSFVFLDALLWKCTFGYGSFISITTSIQAHNIQKKNKKKEKDWYENKYEMPKSHSLAKENSAKS